MKRLLTNKILGLVGFLCLLPAIGSASVITWSLSNLQGGGTSGIGAANVSFSTITINGFQLTDTITETYSYNSGTNIGTLTFKAATSNAAYGFVAGTTFLTITEGSGNLLPNSTALAVNLFQNVTSVVFNDATFATQLGLAGTSFNSAAAVAAGVGATSFSVTNTGSGVVSASGSMSVQTPEPTTFAMLGGALLLAGISLRKKFALNRLSR